MSTGGLGKDWDVILLHGVWIFFDMYEIPIVIRYCTEYCYLWLIIGCDCVGASGLCPIDIAEFRCYYALEVSEIYLLTWI